MGVSVPFRNSILAGTNLVRPAINSPLFQTGVQGWSINKDGSAEFNDVTIRGSLVVTGNAQSSNYLAGSAGWQLRTDGTAEFNGNVDMLSAVITGDIESANYLAGITGWQLRDDGTAEFNGAVDMLSGTVTGNLSSSNYVAGTSGWRLRNDGQAEFNGVFLTGLIDGKVHSGALVDTANNVVGAEVPVTNANPQNTPQIAGHAYRAIVQLSITGTNVANRARFRLWDGTVGVSQLGAIAPLVKINNAATTYEVITLIFVWAASATATLANINLGMEFFSGAGGVTARIETTSYQFLIEDIGLASRITNL